MQDQPTLDEGAVDSTVLARLCEAGPLTPAELEREFGLDALDAVARLVERGLAHRMEGRAFVIASVSGRYAHSLDPTWS